MKNTEEIIKIPVWLVGSDLPDVVKENTVELVGLEARLVVLESRDDNDVDPSGDIEIAATRIAEVKKSLDEKMPEAYKNFLNSLWTKYPNEVIDLRLKIGHLLFDMYEQSYPKPTAPILARLRSKEIQEFADLMNKDEIVISKKAIKAGSDVMGNEEVWKKFIGSAYVKKVHDDDKSEVRSVTLNSSGVNMFKTTIDTIVDLLAEDKK